MISATLTHPARAARRTAGFTLVELMVVVSIIAILAGIALGALNAARNSARRRRTEAIVAKLNHVLMDLYDDYETRRVPISTSGMTPEQAGALRSGALQELMRMEMPQAWTDVTADPNLDVLPHRPALSQLYKQQYDQCLARLTAARPAGQGLSAQGAANLIEKFGSAECIYMIINTGCPDEMGLFTQSELGDADGDGLLEFHDGLDGPIAFDRWEPGTPHNYHIEIR